MTESQATELIRLITGYGLAICIGLVGLQWWGLLLWVEAVKANRRK